jgi:hypothetical protein
VGAVTSFNNQNQRQHSMTSTHTHPTTGRTQILDLHDKVIDCRNGGCSVYVSLHILTDRLQTKRVARVAQQNVYTSLQQNLSNKDFGRHGH